MWDGILHQTIIIYKKGGTIVKTKYFCNFNQILMYFSENQLQKFSSMKKSKIKLLGGGHGLILDFLGKMTKNPEKRCDKYL